MEVSPSSPLDRRRPAPPKDPLKSRITNGSTFLPGVDQSSAWVRRCKDIYAAYLSDLGSVDNTSAAERSILRRASVLEVELERLEAKFATAGEADAGDLDIYARVSANLRRLLEAVGLQRRARDVGPTLGSLLKADMDAQRREAAERERLAREEQQR